jgi:hypothetical protein
MANRFHGSYRDFPKMHGKTGPRGIRASVRIEKRIDAQKRAANVNHERTKAHRLQRCKCTAVDRMAAQV